jgi:hypothetical protein
MNTGLPLESEVTDEIRALQAREWLLLLNEPLTPGECLRRAQVLSITQQEGRRLLDDLDNPKIPPSILNNYIDKYTDYRRYIKGSILDTYRSVQSLDFRWEYCRQIKQDADRFVGLIRDAGSNVDRARELAETAVYVRNSTRDKLKAATARQASELKKVPWEAVKKAGKDFLFGPAKDKHNLDYLITSVNKSRTVFQDMEQHKQVAVLAGVARRSGNTSNLTKVLSASVGPLMATVDLLLVTNDALAARDPYRTMTSYGVRLGAAAVVSTVTEAVALGVVSALAMSTGVGAIFMIAAPMLANGYLNEWIASSAMEVYDDFNPRISAVLRDVAWEPVDFKISLEEEVPMLAMISDFKTSMVDGN